MKTETEKLIIKHLLKFKEFSPENMAISDVLIDYQDSIKLKEQK